MESIKALVESAVALHRDGQTSLARKLTDETIKLWWSLPDRPNLDVEEQVD